MRPTRPYRALQHVVATGVIGVVLGLWAHSQLTGRQMDVLWTVAILALLLASGYVLFGRAMSRGVEDAKEIAGEGDGDQEGG